MKWIRRHKIISGLLAVVALIIIIVAASSGGSKPSTVSTTTTTQAAPDTAGSAANAVTDQVPASTACQALATWENSDSSGNVADQADLAKTFKNTIQPLSGDFAAWAAAVKSGDSDAAMPLGSKVNQDCTALGVPIFSTDTPSPAPTAAAPMTTAPAITTSEQQAVDAAQGYLSLGTGFSKEGLLKQLTSSYGNGFSEKDAEFAVSYLKPDWNAQAVEAAKGYLKLGGFSRASLIQQLTSSYGSGFTEAQAEYAADKVGL